MWRGDEERIEARLRHGGGHHRIDLLRRYLCVAFRASRAALMPRSVAETSRSVPL